MNDTTIDLFAIDDADFISQTESLENNVHDVHHVHHSILDAAIDAKSEVLNGAKDTVDAALAVCIDNPAILGGDEFKNAVNVISLDTAAWFEYRTKIKAAKPTGVPMSGIDGMVENQSSGGGLDSAAELIALVVDKGELFFDPDTDKAFVSTDINGALHTLAIGGKAFVDWLSYSYYSTTKIGDMPGMSASESAIKQACFALCGIAKHDGDRQSVSLRVADYNGGHYIFIGDEQLQVIEVLPTGWRVIKDSPVKFWAPGSMKSLPIPLQQNGDLSKLWEFVNIPEKDHLLILALLLEAFRAETPKPILALTGTQGSAKTSTQDKLKQLIDNSAANVKSAPKTVEDIFVSAGCNRVVSYENLSHLTPAQQDAFCILATGGAHVTRKHYTNDEEATISVKRPVFLNSIPSVITAQDATDRAITIECPRIQYREESEINAAWELAKPAIFGGLLDLFVKTLAMMPKVKLVNPPRMADFTRLGEAMSQAMDNPPGVFDALYKANRAEGISRAMESSPVALAVRELVDAHYGTTATVFSGLMKNLLLALEKYKQESHAWPKSPRGLGDALRRQQPALASIGIDVDISKPGKEGVTVTIIKKVVNMVNVVNIDIQTIRPENKKAHQNSAAMADKERF